MLFQYCYLKTIYLPLHKQVRHPYFCFTCINVTLLKGSGKTAAFLIPIINGLLEIQFNDKHFRDPKAIILAPTRELAQQIYKECLKFTYKTGLKPICVYGGVSIDFKYRSDIKRGCDILIATPGRLIDILKRSLISLSQIKYFCLDEADRLLDRGFEPQIRDIVETSDMPSSGERVSMFFSASYPDEVLKMANDFMRDYYFLKVGKVGSTTENITQVILWAERYEKDKLLIEELKKNIDRVLIFVERKIQVDELKGKLKKNGFKATGIHGGIPQPKRELSLRRFRSGKYPIMVATSIAARGLDIENVSHVINYDLPSNIDEYIHRIGRTGRAGKDGLAISFFNESNNNVAIDLIEVLEQTGQEVPQWLYEYRTWRQNSNKRNYSSESKYFDDFDGIVGAEDEWDNYFF